MSEFNPLRPTALATGGPGHAETTALKPTGEGKVSFADTVKNFLTAVNDSQMQASEKVAEVIQGKSGDIAQAMTALEESRVGFQLMLEIRNKLLESYKEIQRMQV